MKRVADATKPIVPIPLVVVPVHVDFALVVVAIERGIAMYKVPSVSPSLKIPSNYKE